MTEEGLPFLILFHKQDDLRSPEMYKQEIRNQLMGERSKFSFEFAKFGLKLPSISSDFICFVFTLPSSDTVNFLTADGEKFSHPLGHLGKSNADLPLIAVDSFRHMYLFPKFEDIT